MRLKISLTLPSPLQSTSFLFECSEQGERNGGGNQKKLGNSNIYQKQ